MRQSVYPLNPCALAPLFQDWFCSPDPQNTFAYDGVVSRVVGDLFWLTMWWALAVVIIVFGATFVAIARYRRRPGHGIPTQVHGNTRFEVTWTILPTLILVLIGVPSVQVLFELTDPPSPNPLDVEVVGHQWWWEFRYPGLNVTTATDLHIPVGQPVRLTLVSADVQHSFWAPRLAGKTDLLPPRVNHMWLNASQPGTYFGQCAELCGVQHAQMRFYVVAEPTETFQAWVRGQQAGPTDTAGTVATRGQAALLSGGCIACHTVQGTIAQGTIGPNLTHVGSRTTLAGGILPNTPDNLRRWLKDPQEVKVGNLMILPRPLTDEEINDLVPYLGSLR
jgi:cytochrome c oxidase subunit 2